MISFYKNCYGVAQDCLQSNILICIITLYGFMGNYWFSLSNVAVLSLSLLGESVSSVASNQNLADSGFQNKFVIIKEEPGSSVG